MSNEKDSEEKVKEEDGSSKEEENAVEVRKEELSPHGQIEANDRVDAEDFEAEKQSAKEDEVAEEANKSTNVIEEQIEQVKRGISEKKSNSGNNSSEDVKSLGDSTQAEDQDDNTQSYNEFREFHYHPGGHYHPGAYSDILNPAYIRYVNHNLGGLRFLGALRALMWIAEDEPPRRIMAWSCCANQEKTANGCKLREDSPPRYHPGMFSCFCHDCKAQINGFETSRCAEPCQGNWAQRAPNTYSMTEKNFEKDDDQIEFVALQTLESIFFKSEWPKRSACKRNWFEWTCCGSPLRSADGCRPVILPGDKENDTTTIRL